LIDHDGKGNDIFVGNLAALEVNAQRIEFEEVEVAQRDELALSGDNAGRRVFASFFHQSQFIAVPRPAKLLPAVLRRSRLPV
jgi:hypothetical protein